MKVAQPVLEGGDLVMEGRTRNQDMDAGIGEMQLADVAIIRDDINIEPGIGLFQQRVDDGGKEIRLLIGGDEDTEGIVLSPGRRQEWMAGRMPIIFPIAWKSNRKNG
jgi:hypothetical protein